MNVRRVGCSNCLETGALSFELVDHYESGRHITLLFWCGECDTETAMTLTNTYDGCRVTQRAQ